MGESRIVVLANSIKLGGRCVAGRRIDATGQLGEWLRPIGDAGEGELLPRHMLVADRGVAVLDLFDVPTVSHARDRCHPEDWVVSGAHWRRAGVFSRARLLQLQDRPRDLWIDDRKRTDRVTCQTLHRRPKHQSLYLIRPWNFRVQLSQEYNRYENCDKKRSRAVFKYAGVQYNLGMTDPVFTVQYCNAFPKTGAPPMEIRPPFGDQCLLCVSLTPTFNGYHYKVVATVLELPQPTP